MAGTTLTMLQSQSGARVVFTANIEGIPWVLTTDEPQAAYDAYSGIGVPITSAYSGLTVHWESDQKMSPSQPFPEPMLLKLSVAPASGYVSGTGLVGVSDIVGETVFKRTGTNAQTGITLELDCDDTTLNVQRADDFAATGVLYIGPETMSYSSRDTAADTFTIDQRGVYTSVYTESFTPFTRTHKPLTTNEQDIGIPPVASTEPRTWIGRWVVVWAHRVSSGGVLDAPNFDRAAAHPVFAGQIVEVGDDNGLTWFTIADVRRSIYGTRMNKDPFRARAAEGVFVAAGASFGVNTRRLTTTGGTSATGNALTVVSSGAAGTNQMNEGRYTAHELAAILQTWLQGERAASRILFNLQYVIADDNGTSRGCLKYHDPTAAGISRSIEVSCSYASPLRFSGWTAGSINAGGTAQSGETMSDEVPLRFWMQESAFDLQTLNVTNPTGTWVSQITLLPPALRDPVNNVIDGVLKIGDIGYVRARHVSDTQFQITEDGMAGFFPGSIDGSFNSIRYTIDEPDISLDVSQVLVIESTFKDLLLRVLLSTGTSGFNSTYDDLSEYMSCGIPYQLLGDDFVSEVGRLACADLTCTAVIDGPISFFDMFKADFQLRRCALIWGNGRLNIKAWSTPTSSYATTTLNETTKATPIGTQDVNRASVVESADFANVVTIRYDIDVEGKYHGELILRDAVSIRLYGERSLEIKARNTFRQTGSIGSPLDELLSIYAGFFGYTSRPWQIVTRSIDWSMFEQTLPGTVCLVTDKYLRDPSTGKRYSNLTQLGGLSGYPGLIVGQEIDWGGVAAGLNGGRPQVNEPGGQVQVMISPQRTIAEYVPCAQFNGTDYNAGTKVVTTQAHEHSESSDVADASRFAVGDEVLVVEIDPSVAASALSWSDVVANVSGNNITLTTGLAGIDTALTYRIIYDAYGTVGTSQKTKTFQADDADGLIVDTSQAYAFAYFGIGQSTVATATTGQEVPARHSTLAYGDGKAFDVGYERDTARLLNNYVNYKSAFQSPTANSEVRNYGGAGTRQLVELFPVFLGIGGLSAGRSRLISLAPRMRSTDGNVAGVRVTYSARRPSGTTRDDVTRNWPYTSVTFTTSTTANFVIPSVSTIDFARGGMADGPMGAVNWVYVEITSNAEYTGLGRLRLGALA